MSTPAEILSKRRNDFEDTLEALRIPATHRDFLRAAASSWAKAASAAAVAEFVQARRGVDSLAPN